MPALDRNLFFRYEYIINILSLGFLLGFFYSRQVLNMNNSDHQSEPKRKSEKIVTMWSNLLLGPERSWFHTQQTNKQTKTVSGGFNFSPSRPKRSRHGCDAMFSLG